MALAGASTSGFGISPTFGQVDLAAGQAQAQYDIKLTNHNSVDQSFRLSVVDFGTLDEEGGVAFLGTPTSELEHKYGLASWMSLSSDAAFVSAGQTTRITITIANRPSLSPGGHYGAVLATAVTDDGKPEGDRVGVQQVLASLVLATKEGGAERDLRLVGQTTNARAWRLPTRVEQRYQNAGNVHVTPRGVVQVRDPWGRVVRQAAINDGSGVILPESFRRYTTQLLSVRRAWMPGRYQVVSTYRYDGTTATKTFTTSVWYAGLAIVWVVGIAGLVATGVLAWWLWRRYHR